MRTREPQRNAIAVTLALVTIFGATSCGSVRGSRMAPSLTAATVSARGSWTVLELTGSDHLLGGELLAATRDSLYLIPNDCPSNGCGALAVAIEDIERGHVFKYRPEQGVGVWAATGAVSTLSHGVLLVFTLPMWAVSGILASHSITSEAQIHVSKGDYDLVDVMAWARFPQGLPEEMRGARFDQPAWIHDPDSHELDDEGGPVRLKKKYD